MKKLFLLSALVPFMGLVSCNNGEYSETQTISVPVLNIITNLDNGNTVASPGVYSFDLKWTNTTQTGSVSSTNIIYNNGTSTLSTNTSDFDLNTLSPIGYYGYIFKDVTGNVSGSLSYPISNSLFYVTSGWNTIETAGTNIGEYTFNSPSFSLVSKYSLGSDYIIKTFPIQSFFRGVTTSHYNGTSSQTTGIWYRFDINTTENKARLIMYNAKFSANPNEPEKTAVLLENLDVEFSQDGILIKGNDIIPKVYESNGWTPYEAFTFDSITFMTTDLYLTKANIEYSVAGRYNASFVGQYILDPELDNE